MNINDRGVIYGAGVPAGVRPQDVESGGHVFLLIPCEDEQECVTARRPDVGLFNSSHPGSGPAAQGRGARRERI
jgi:hypothetical protein